MQVRFKFRSTAAAEDVALKLPVACKWSLLRDCTSDVYLEVPECYENYVSKYLLNQKGGPNVLQN